MGTRLLFGKKVRSGDQTIQLKHKGVWLGSSATTEITNQITKARECVTNTITAISGGRISRSTNEWAAKYFLTGDGGPSQGEWSELLAILELTKGGLCSNFTLKLKGDDAHGFVKRHRVEAGTPGSVIINGKSWTREGHSMHVSKKTMLASAELGTITVIHEATHKYGNTKDHGDSGYRFEDDSGYEEPGLTRAQAFVNADSIAYFCYRVGSVVRL